MEVDDEAIDRCARRLMQLQDGSVEGKGDQIRQIISDEVGIPVGITTERQDWINDISSLLTEIQWKATQTIRTGFGQGVTLVTPIAVARYVSAIANKGTVYDAHIVDRVLDREGNLAEEFEPTIYNEIDIPDAVWGCRLRRHERRGFSGGWRNSGKLFFHGIPGKIPFRFL